MAALVRDLTMAADGGLDAGLTRVGRAVVAAGLVVGSGGNLSARCPGGRHVRVTTAGAWLDELSRGSFVTVALPDTVDESAAPDRHAIVDSGALVRDGADVDSAAAVDSGASAGPTSELALHLAIYRVRPDVNVIVHLHPQTTILLDALGERIRLITTDHAFYVRRIAVAAPHPPGTQELADAVAASVADGTDCVILPHHGCAVLADTVDMALRRALNLDEAARLTYRALLLTGGVPGRSIVECPISFPNGSTV